MPWPAGSMTSAGFVEVGRRKAYYARPGEAATALVLRRNIG